MEQSTGHPEHPQPSGRRQTVLITGGAGYVGSVLVARLLALGYGVRVLDLYLYGRESLEGVRSDPRLVEIRGDIRDRDLLVETVRGCDAVIHLACISNDPSFELNPTLSRSINYDAFGPLVRASKENGIRRFIYASTASVYGVSEAEAVTEEHPLLPVTDYNRYKGLCEPLLLDEQSRDFTVVVIRPSTVCGCSPRQRFDLTVNLLTNHAVRKGRMTVFGGMQKRPNIHMEDMVDLYLRLLEEPGERIAGKVFNVGTEVYTIAEIAERVRSVVREVVPERGDIQVETVPSDDIRSYQVSSEKIARELGFRPKRSVRDAVMDLCRAFSHGSFPGSLDDSRYYNVRRMKEVRLS